MRNWLTGVLLLLYVSTYAQTDVNLVLTHEFNGEPFYYGQNLTNIDGKIVSLSRVQYYLSGFDLTHDGGNQTYLSDVYVLASGNISNYPLDNINVNSIENISFSLGVDSVANHGNTTNWPSSHPLSAQSPSMDWAWPSGYFFFVINGQVDSDGDNIPETEFQLNGVGDHLLHPVSVSCSFMEVDSSITVDIYVNIADWLAGIDLETVGYAHDGGSHNQKVSTNTSDQTVFSCDPSVSMLDIKNGDKNSLYVDRTFAYAPTIYYQLVTNQPVDITVHDINGKVVAAKYSATPEGNYFIGKELAPGMYWARFENNDVAERIQLIISK